MTTITRTTRETDIRIELVGDDTVREVDTSIPFLDHMLITLARYAGIGLRVVASGDLPHHISEDVAIAIGAAFAAYVPERCARYGDCTVPMDDALVQCCVDIGGRSYYAGRLPSARYEHWMRSFAEHARATIHIRVLRGRDRHHVVEAAFKALGMALRQALTVSDTLLSTKGSVSLEVGP